MLPKFSKTSDPHQTDNQDQSFRSRLRLAIALPLWVLAGFFLAQVLLVVVILIFNVSGVSIIGVNMSVINTITAAVIYLTSVAIVVGLPDVLKKSRTSLEELGLHRLPSWKDIGFSAAGFIVYIFIAALILNAVGRLIPGFDAEEAQDIGFENLALRYEYVLAFVTLVIIAPVAEEILMRGYLYGKLRKIAPLLSAAVITAVVFALLHLTPEFASSGFKLTQWNVAVDVFALSLVLTSLRELTGSIWSSILVHMMKNGLAFYLLFINPTFLNTIGG